MRIVSWNVNGIRAVAGKGFADAVKAMDADIIGIQETKAQIDQLGPEITELDGYKSWFYSAEKKGYSGTALYSRIEPENVTFGLGTDEFDHEGRTICADFGKFVLFNIYFPNGGRGDDYVKFKLRFYDCFLDRVDARKADARRVELLTCPTVYGDEIRACRFDRTGNLRCGNLIGAPSKAYLHRDGNADGILDRADDFAAKRRICQ